MGTVLNSKVNPIAKAFRVHSVRIESSPAALGAAAVCSIEWYSGDSGLMTREEYATTNTPDMPAILRSSPPSSCAAWYWRTVSNVGGNATVPLFNLTCNPGSIIELDVSHILNDTLFTSWPDTVAAAALGEMYYSGLSGFGSIFVPLKLNTTA
jgi:hypothetical protein